MCVEVSSKKKMFQNLQQHNTVAGLLSLAEVVFYFSSDQLR